MTLCQQTRRDACSLMLCSSSCPETVTFASSIRTLAGDAISGCLLIRSDIPIHSVVEHGCPSAYHAGHHRSTDGDRTSADRQAWLCLYGLRQMIGLVSMLNWRLVQQPDMEVVACLEFNYSLVPAHRVVSGRVEAAGKQCSIAILHWLAL